MATPETKNEVDSVSSIDSLKDFQFQSNKTDLFCFINSEWAYKLVVSSQSGEVSQSDICNRNDRNFVIFFNDVCHRTEFQSKSVSLKFEYTSESHVIREPFLGPLFNLPTNMDALIKHLHTRLSIPVNKTNEIPPDKLITLVSSVNAAFAYQSKNKLWLSTKLFYLRNAPSSDDSGVVISRRKKSRAKSIRSRSAETVSCQQNKCLFKNNRQCATCELKTECRSRANSCNLSFYPPDSEFDDTSLRYSLLETKLVDVNERYAYIVNNKLKTDDECFTLDGQSV